jgi:hypothetical protein
MIMHGLLFTVVLLLTLATIDAVSPAPDPCGLGAYHLGAYTRREGSSKDWVCTTSSDDAKGTCKESGKKVPPPVGNPILPGGSELACEYWKRASHDAVAVLLARREARLAACT